MAEEGGDFMFVFKPSNTLWVTCEMLLFFQMHVLSLAGFQHSCEQTAYGQLTMGKIKCNSPYCPKGRMVNVLGRTTLIIYVCVKRPENSQRHFQLIQGIIQSTVCPCINLPLGA